MVQLPIDSLLPEIVAILRRDKCLVVEAPPGAGKTTRVPPALLDQEIAHGGKVIVLEPRRLAARMAARRVASEMGEKVGETTGYQVRFEEVAGPKTQLEYVTEGLFTRWLLAEPDLPGVAAVVLDEFHERHLQGDLALALLHRLQQRQRPDLRLIVMSATLDVAPVAQYLGAPSLRSEGRRFDVAIEYLDPAEAARLEVPLERRIAAAVRRVIHEGLSGDVLVFLPGAAEIRRASEACEQICRAAGLEIFPLYGDLSPEEQDRAVLPGSRPKLILSTNVAETSITIENVVTVIDSGLARIASHSPWSGLPRLEVKKVSRASAAQRAGRAGRMRPGLAIRLYTRHDHDSRPEFELPEVKREDLAETVLALAAMGAANDLRWLEPPPESAVGAARALLGRLGALGEDGTITDVGRGMLRFPLHPRQAALLLAAQVRGAVGEGCLVAALLGERDIRSRSIDSSSGALMPTGPSDLLELAALVGQAEKERFVPNRLRALGLESGPTLNVDRSRKQLLRLSGARPSERSNQAASEVEREKAILYATLAAYPDRLARRRTQGKEEVVLEGGGSAKLDRASVVREAEILVVVDVEERKAGRSLAGGARSPFGGVAVRLASAVTEEMLFDLFPDRLRYVSEVVWNDEAERVDGVEKLLYCDLVIEEKRASRVDPEQAAVVLAQAALARGARAFAKEGGLDRLLSRLTFVARHCPESAIVTPSETELRALLVDLSLGRRSFAELREAGLEGALFAKLDPAQRVLVDRMAPGSATLPGGRSVRIEYGPGDAPPHIESRLQDFFGMASGPAIAGGRVPLVLHLLAPNHRAVQVTADLRGFWERHYPALRRELGRRYPRHAWPEDPLGARPPAPKRPAR